MSVSEMVGAYVRYEGKIHSPRVVVVVGGDLPGSFIV